MDVNTKWSWSIKVIIANWMSGQKSYNISINKKKPNLFTFYVIRYLFII